jgi:polar amino acid transport system substrate-binding protein
LEKTLQNDLELSKSDFINVKKLIRDQEGSVIVFSSFLTDLKKQKGIFNKLKINKQKYVIKSYYVAFSKKSLFARNEKILIWKEIGNISNNKKIMNKILSKYSSLEKNF